MDGIQRAPADLTNGTNDLPDRHLSDRSIVATSQFDPSLP
jgi:hypothetical protein